MTTSHSRHPKDMSNAEIVALLIDLISESLETLKIEFETQNPRAHEAFATAKREVEVASIFINMENTEDGNK